jgi:1-acyl-sn-glycerol-3-phosphate acyltransferase
MPELRTLIDRLRQTWASLREQQTPGMHLTPDSGLPPRVRRFRALFRPLALWIEKTLTQTTITGLENIPAQRPLIFAPNHASTYDAMLLIAHLPEETELVGPGDFKLLFPANVLIAWGGIVRIKRAALDRDSLKIMSSALERGLNLALFPEGGTWEKPLDAVKPGVAYLSAQHNVPILPISFGGTYGVWDKIIRLKRPKITIHFGEPLPPVVIADRKLRGETLQRASSDLMTRIYERLPDADRARYDVAAAQVFHGRVYATNSAQEAQDDAPDFAVLAELASKPNLVSPLYRNAKLPLRPLLDHERDHAAADFVIAVERLQHAFSGEYAGYLDYRLGEAKAKAVHDELAALRALALDAHHRALRLRFVPRVEYVYGA